MSNGPSQSKIDILKGITCCPLCRSEINHDSHICTKCKKDFQVRENKYFFDDSWEHNPASTNWLNSIKENIKKRFSKAYPLIVDVLSPVLPIGNPLKALPMNLPDRPVIINAGSGTTYYRPDVINIDQGPYKTVDIVASLERLPIKDQSVDLIINVAVLEHVRDPRQVISEFYRVLKPGGFLYAFIPFLQGEHASPFDFQRFTSEGSKELLSCFELVTIKSHGPTSSLIWVLQEWLALVFSLGSQKIYRAVLPLTWILSPIKFLDLLLNHHPSSGIIATGNIVLVRKRGSDKS